VVGSIAIGGERSLEAAVALVKWFADMGADVDGVEDRGSGVDIRLSLSSVALRNVMGWRRASIVERNHVWNAAVRERCSATSAWLAEMRAALHERQGAAGEQGRADLAGQMKRKG